MERIKKLVHNFTHAPHYKYTRVIIYAFIIFIATFTLTEQRGFFRTLPFILILPAVATFFYNKKLLTVILCGILAMFFGLVDSSDIAVAALLAILAMIFSSIGIVSKRLFITGTLSETKRSICYILAVVLVVAGIVGYFGFFGNPVDLVGKHSDNVKYIRSAYPDETITIGKTAFDFYDRTYYTSCKIICGNTKIIADISAKSPPHSDKFRKYLEYTLLGERITELSRTIMSNLPGESVLIREVSVDESVALTSSLTADDVRAHMSFDIAFIAQLTDISDFAKKCDEYIRALDSASFDYKTITFYGGFADEYRFCAVYEKSNDTPVSLSDIPKTAFDRDANVDDFCDGWRYTF